MDIVDMYDHYTVGDTAAHVPIPATSSKMHSSGLNLPPSDCFVFVHGWRMEPWERRRFAETAYKRLWWFGFRDRFVFFSWPTEYVNSSLVLTQPNNFNNSEWQAWSSGVPLKALLLDLKADPNNLRVMVFAHSMGNVAVGEALRLLTDSGNAETVDKYVAMQGAIPAHTYDQNAETVPVVLNPAIPNRYKDFWPLSTIPKTYACYFDGGNAARDYINWFNRVDYALDKWTINQSLKPIASQFYYDTVGQHFMQYSTVLNLPPDQYAVFSQALPAVCWALGAQPGVNGSFSTGLERDLHSVDLFDGTSSDHSAQFNSNIQKRLTFWRALLAAFKTL